MFPKCQRMISNHKIKSQNNNFMIDKDKLYLLLQFLYSGLFNESVSKFFRIKRSLYQISVKF